LEIPFSILTNGFWSKPQWLVEKLQNSPNFINLHISLHGSNAKDHESFTLTPNSFHKIIDNIKLATRMKLPVSTGTVITRWNYSKSSEIVTLCEELEVGLVNFNRFIGMDWVGVSASAEQVVYCLRDIQKLKDLGKNIEISTCIPKCFESSATKRCLAGFASCSIDPWGNVTPCIHTNMMVGSLLVNTIDDIWNSIFFQKWRNLTNKDCICCSLLEICGGGCKADIFSSTKSTDFVVSPTSDNRAELPVEFTFLSMPANAKIRAVFKITKSNNGYVLYKGSKLLSVKTEVVQILEAIKDRRLCDVEKEWGQTILSIVGKLFDDGLVELEQEEK